jgi:predicted ester cyclase
MRFGGGRRSKMGNLYELAERHYAAFVAGDETADRELFHPDVVTIDPSGRLEGLDAFNTLQRRFRAAFPDGHFEVGAYAESGSTLMVEGTYVGTNTGPMAGPGGETPATGNTLRLRYCDVFEFRDGRVAVHRIYYDQMAIMTQLGLMGAPA